MSIEALRKAIQDLDKHVQEEDLGVAHFSNPDYEPYPLAPENIKEIKEVKSDRKIAFVDGGNQELLGAPNFSVQINKVYFCIFQGDKRILVKSLPPRIEFFSTTYSTMKPANNNNEVYYDTELFPTSTEITSLLPDVKDLSFSSFDRSVTIGNQRADIARVASIARRFAEWTMASNIVEAELDKDDIVVIDGSLESAFKHEPKYLGQLFSMGKKNGVTITGLSKTSRLFTNSGLSLLGAVQKVSESVPYAKWYLPIAFSKSASHEAVILVAKFHKAAERVFRYEIQRDQFKDLKENEIEEIIGQLANNSKDIAFPGYPYGLVDADTFGRVRDEEVGHYQAILMSEISKLGKWKKFARHLHSIDAHDYLNMVIG